jgi:hypothetical protein
MHPHRLGRGLVRGAAALAGDRGVFPTKRRKKGFEGAQRSYVESHPNHLVSGSLKCGAWGGAIGLVSGKGSGYYGCLSASRRAPASRSPCDPKTLARAGATTPMSSPFAVGAGLLSLYCLVQGYSRPSTLVTNPPTCSAATNLRTRSFTSALLPWRSAAASEM